MSKAAGVGVPWLRARHSTPSVTMPATNRSFSDVKEGSPIGAERQGRTLLNISGVAFSF